MYKTVHGIVLQIIHYGDTSIIARVLTKELGLISFIYKGVRKKRKSQETALLFPGAVLSIEFNYYPQKNIQYAQKSHLDHSYFITQQSVVKHCIMIFLIETMKNLIVEGQENIELYDLYLHAIDIMYRSEESECANLPIYSLIQMAEISGYKIINNYSESNNFCAIENGSFTSHISNTEAFLWHRHLNFFLSHNSWDQVSLYQMNKEERKKILELYIRFIQVHLSQFSQFKSLAILSMVIS